MQIELQNPPELRTIEATHIITEPDCLTNFIIFVNNGTHVLAVPLHRVLSISYGSVKEAEATTTTWVKTLVGEFIDQTGRFRYIED